jgi:DNA-directed RNA polymerase subunit RPC12/RpoP
VSEESKKLQSITDVKVGCANCGWEGTIGETESGDDGQLACPNCGELVNDNPVTYMLKMI